MRILLPVLAVPALAACTSQQPPAQSAAPPPPPPSPPGTVGGVMSCDLTIEFGSYAMGIDVETRSRVEALLVADRAVTGFETRRWGREGEVNFCVRTRSAVDSARLFQGIRPMIPARPRGPIAMRTNGGLSYRTPPLR